MLICDIKYRQQPWSTYAVHLPTLTGWAFLIDALLMYLAYKSTESWSPDAQAYALTGFLFWIFFSKFIKVFGHFLRYPFDIFLFPLGLLFSYAHGAWKFYAMLTLDVVSYFVPVTV